MDQAADAAVAAAAADLGGDAVASGGGEARGGASLFWQPLMMSLLAGGATGLGAMVILLFGKGRPDKRHMSFSLALAASVMMTVSLFDMYLPLVRSDGLFLPTVVGLLGAGAFGALMHVLPDPETLMLLPLANGAGGFPRGGGVQGARLSRAADSESPAHKDKRRGKHWRLGVLMLIVLTAHNLPEGLAVSLSELKAHNLGFVVTVAIALHNIPEGIAIAVPLFAATQSKSFSIGMAFLSGLSEPLGALIGLIFVSNVADSPWVVEYVLCWVAGIMVAVSVTELVPEALAYKHPPSFGAGYLSGFVVMLTTIWLQPE